MVGKIHHKLRHRKHHHLPICQIPYQLPPNAVPSAAPAPVVELENQRREANEALERGQQARPAEVQSNR